MRAADVYSLKTAFFRFIILFKSGIVQERFCVPAKYLFLFLFLRNHFGRSVPSALVPDRNGKRLQIRNKYVNIALNCMSVGSLK